MEETTITSQVHKWVKDAVERKSTNNELISNLGSLDALCPNQDLASRILFGVNAEWSTNFMTSRDFAYQYGGGDIDYPERIREVGNIVELRREWYELPLRDRSPWTVYAEEGLKAYRCCNCGSPSRRCCACGDQWCFCMIL
jgi:hypothetical protein